MRSYRHLRQLGPKARTLSHFAVDGRIASEEFTVASIQINNIAAQARTLNVGRLEYDALRFAVSLIRDGRIVDKLMVVRHLLILVMRPYIRLARNTRRFTS